jgi:PAS domain S-box-containing protein
MSSTKNNHDFDLTTAMDVSLDGMAVLENNRFIYVNVSHAKMFGYTANELIGQHWQCLYATEQVEDFYRNAFPALDTSGHWRGEATALRKDGSTFDEEVTLVLLENDQLICICRDITDQKRVEINLREQEEQYRSIFETANDGLSIWELDIKKFVTANPMEFQLYGYSEAEYVSLMPKGIIHPDFLHLFDEAIDIIKEGQEFYGNSVVIRKDKTLIDVEVKGMLCFYNGKPHGLFITRDISDRKRAETVVLQKTQELEKALQEIQTQEHQVRQQKERLEIANIELARASRLKDEFLATISHELRTPLNGILGMTDILLEDILGPLTERQRKSVMTIEKSGAHLSTLINEVLDVTRIESGQLEIEPMPVILEQLCLNSLSMIAPIAAQKNILLEGIVPSGLQPIQVDEKRMQQVLNNLLTNAVKFTPEGGQVCLHLEADSEYQQLRFHIKDTGIGIPEQELERIFDRFVQVDGKLNRHQGGLGIGLAIAKRIVTLHQGSITVKSTVGKGSCFSINLPYFLTH